MMVSCLLFDISELILSDGERGNRWVEVEIGAAFTLKLSARLWPRPFSHSICDQRELWERPPGPADPALAPLYLHPEPSWDIIAAASLQHVGTGSSLLCHSAAVDASPRPPATSELLYSG
jgi:hypothetical protein